MTRRSILTVLIGSCLIALTLSFFTATLAPSVALADGTGGQEPPVNAQPDTTLTAPSPTSPEPGAASAEQEKAQALSFFETVEIMVRVIF